MSVISKELLQRLEQSVFKETAIKKDAQEYYFYLSVVETPPNNIGTEKNIPIQHITDQIEIRPNKMIVLSIVTTSVLVTGNKPPLPLYIRIKGINSATRYHFLVGDGLNNFNTSNVITLPSGDFPRGIINVEYGTYLWDNDLDGQQQMGKFTDAGGEKEIASLDIKFKVQTVTLE
jgi:hypothetical protein